MTRRRVWGTNPQPILTRGVCAFLCGVACLLAVWLLLACAIASGDRATARVGTLLDASPEPASAASAASSPIRRILER